VRREPGSGPGETQRQDEAQRSREALDRLEGERAAEQRRSPREESPVAEHDADRPTPRR
jgi:hypothetical protein